MTSKGKDNRKQRFAVTNTLDETITSRSLAREKKQTETQTYSFRRLAAAQLSPASNVRLHRQETIKNGISSFVRIESAACFPSRVQNRCRSILGTLNGMRRMDDAHLKERISTSHRLSIGLDSPDYATGTEKFRRNSINPNLPFMSKSRCGWYLVPCLQCDLSLRFLSVFGRHAT